MDNINRTIYKIAKEANSNRVTVFTNHLKIDGYILECEGSCREIADNILTLNDAVVCRLEEYCTCEDEECGCNDIVCFKYEWLNIMHKKIVAFSVKK